MKCFVLSLSLFMACLFTIMPAEASHLVLTVVNEWDDIIHVKEGGQYPYPKDYPVMPGKRIDIDEYMPFLAFSALFYSRSGQWLQIPNCDLPSNTKSVRLTLVSQSSLSYPRCVWN